MRQEMSNLLKVKFIDNKCSNNIFMPQEWNLGASSFCPVCDSVAKNLNLLALTFEQ